MGTACSDCSSIVCESSCTALLVAVSSLFGWTLLAMGVCVLVALATNAPLAACCSVAYS